MTFEQFVNEILITAGITLMICCALALVSVGAVAMLISLAKIKYKRGE